MLTEMDRAYYENPAREKAIRDHNQMMLETMSLEQVSQTLKMSVAGIQQIVST